MSNLPICNHCQKIINKLQPWQLKAKAEIENKCSEKRRNREKCDDNYLQFLNYSSHQELCSQCREMNDILEAGEEMADRCDKCIQDRNRGRDRNKGSTIKLVNEMSESDGKLGEKDNWLSERIKDNIEVPSKDYCRVM